jgi:hypothetical protein
MKAMRWMAVAAVILFGAVSAAGQLTTVTASNITGDSGKPIAHGEIDFYAVTLAGNPVQPRIGGGGLAVYQQARCIIVVGAITTATDLSTCTLVDTNLSNPAHFCYKAQVRDTTVTPNWLSPWIKCMQPYGSTWNMDTQYQPDSQPTALVQTGPAGPPGPSGGVGLTGAADPPTLSCSSTVNTSVFYTSNALHLYQCFDNGSGYAWHPVGGSTSGAASNALVQFSGLVGAFTDSSGNVIEPVWIGLGPVTMGLPSGATRLQLGVEDSFNSDNTGSWTVSVNGTNYTVLGSAQPWANADPKYPITVTGGTSPTVIPITSLSLGTPVVVAYVSGTVTNGGAGTFTAAGSYGSYHNPPGSPGYYALTPPSISSNPMIAPWDLSVGGANGYPTRLPASEGWLHFISGTGFVFDNPPGSSSSSLVTLEPTGDVTLPSGSAIVRANCPIACTMTLPATLPSNYFATIVPVGAGVLSIDPNGNAYDGPTTIPPYAFVGIWVNAAGTGYESNWPLTVDSSMTMTATSDHKLQLHAISAGGGASGQLASATPAGTTVYDSATSSGWPTLADFTVSGTTPTSANNAITFNPGTSNSFDAQALTLNSAVSADDEVDASLSFQLVSLGSGIAVGRLSHGDAVYNDSLVYNPSAKTLTYYQSATGSPGTTLATWNVAHSASAGDQMVLVYSQRQFALTATLYDITGGWSEQYTFEIDTVGSVPATSYWKIAGMGGNQLIERFHVVSYQPFAPYIAIMSDSKLDGGYAETRLVNLLAGIGTVANFGGPGDHSAEAQAAAPYICNFKPQFVLLNIGRNDIIGSFTAGTAYSAAVTALQGCGITVVHMLPIPETMISDQSSLTNFINTTYPSACKIDPSTGWSNAVDLGIDSVHPNTLGRLLIAKDVYASSCFAPQANLISARAASLPPPISTPGQVTYTASDISKLSYVADTGAMNAYVAVLSPPVSALTPGLVVRIKPLGNNTINTPTLTVNGITATITKSGSSLLAPNDIVANTVATFVFNGVYMELQNPQTLACGSGVPCSTGNNSLVGTNTLTPAAFNQTPVVIQGVVTTTPAAYIQGVKGPGNGAGTTITGVVAGHTLIGVCQTTAHNPTLGGLSDSQGDSYSVVVQENPYWNTEVFIATNVHAGNHTSLCLENNDELLWLFEFSTVTSSPLDGTATISHATANQPITTTQAGSIVFYGAPCFDLGGGLSTNSGSFTPVLFDSNSNAFSYFQAAAAGTYTPAISNTCGNPENFTIALKGTLGASQTANLVSYRNPSGTELGGVTAAGQFTGPVVSKGTTFSISGCSPTSITGGSTRGTFLAGTTSCSATVTMGDSQAAPNGWICSIRDLTTPADLLTQSGTTTTTATFSGTVVSGDKIAISCDGY